MERYYNIIGMNICIAGSKDELYTDEHRLAPFQSVGDKKDVIYQFVTVNDFETGCENCIFESAGRKVYKEDNKIIQYIGSVRDNLDDAYIKCESEENFTKVEVKREKLTKRITSKVVLSALGIESLALQANAFILHASFIEINGNAILFTAPSGTGKSTQAELWKSLRGAKVINGDRVAVKVGENDIRVFGIPFAGSSEYCENANFPLKAVICLEQASKSKIKSLHPSVAFRRIWREITIPIWEKQAMERISEMIFKVLEKIPIYHLACTPDESAVIALENELRKEW